MIKVISRVLILIGLLTVAGAAVGGWLVYHIVFETPSLPDAVVLTIDLDHRVVEETGGNPLRRRLFGGDLSLRDVTNALDQGAQDPRVKGAVIRLGGDAMGFAQVQEVRAALARFRAAGRFVTAFAESFGEFGPGNKSYYLASACDQIWLQPIGMVGLTGLSVEAPFARKVLDQYHVVPDVHHREEYKSAMEMLTEPTISGPHKEMLESLLDDLTDQLVGGVSAARHLEPAAVRGLVDRGPLLAAEAKDAGLIDRIGYYDEVVDDALDKAGRAGAEAGLTAHDDYLDAKADHGYDAPNVALIVAAGEIARGEGGGSDPLTGGEGIGSDRLVQAFQQAADDDDVRAILFRIDSPGGSAVASETIRRAVVQAQAAGKPVIVSMSDTAASGGYWIAMNADRIVAQPGTLTGSIGVIVGKVATSGLWDSLGVVWDGVKRGQNAGIWSNIKPYSTGEHARVEAVLDDLYGAFMRNVAEARRLSPDKVHEIARGRVWTGHQALALGLVDELGDMDLALRRVREAAHMKPAEQIHMDVFPRPRSRIDQLSELLNLGGIRARQLVQAVSPVVAAVHGVLAPPETLRMPAFQVR